MILCARGARRLPGVRYMARQSFIKCVFFYILDKVIEFMEIQPRYIYLKIFISGTLKTSDGRIS